VALACSFCHVGRTRCVRRRNPENPKWENLNDYVGAQYLKVWAMFVPRSETGKDRKTASCGLLESMAGHFVYPATPEQSRATMKPFIPRERVKRAAKADRATGRRRPLRSGMNRGPEAAAPSILRARRTRKGTLVIPRVP